MFDAEELPVFARIKHEVLVELWFISITVGTPYQIRMGEPETGGGGEDNVIVSNLLEEMSV